MKPVQPILKIVTLSLFVILISGFVAYRAGALDRMTGKSSVDSPVTDSVKFVPPIMSSSKSVIVTPYEAKPKPGTNANHASGDEPVIMPSSKSGAIFVPEPDTVKEVPQQQQQQQKPKK